MIKAKLTILRAAGLLSVSSLVAFANNGAPVDTGGMPPSMKMNAGSGPENALPPGSILMKVGMEHIHKSPANYWAFMNVSLW